MTSELSNKELGQKALAVHKTLCAIELKYNKLLMAIESKFPGETRHETALRYIKDRENGVVCTPGEVKLTDAKPIKP